MPTQSQNKLSHEESLTLYERQTSYVRTVVNHSPQLLSVLDGEEYTVFVKYFLPDLAKVGNFVHYYEQWEQNDPEMISMANSLLQKFLKKNNLKMA